MGTFGYLGILRFPSAYNYSAVHVCLLAYGKPLQFISFGGGNIENIFPCSRGSRASCFSAFRPALMALGHFHDKTIPVC